MADVKEKDLPKITSYSDIKELRLIKTDGSSVSMTVDNFINAVAEKIARVDGFASVVAELVGNPLGTKREEVFDDLDEYDSNGIYSVDFYQKLNSPSPNAYYGFLIVMKNIAGQVLQLASVSNVVYTRNRKANGTWSAWREL